MIDEFWNLLRSIQFSWSELRFLITLFREIYIATINEDIKSFAELVTLNATLASFKEFAF